MSLATPSKLREPQIKLYRKAMNQAERVEERVPAFYKGGTGCPRGALARSYEWVFGNLGVFRLRGSMACYWLVSLR